jgi:hypothetical protein
MEPLSIASTHHWYHEGEKHPWILITRDSMDTINSSQGAMTNLPCRPDNVPNRITVHSTFLALAIVYASIATPVVSLCHCSLSHEANTANRDGVLQSNRVGMSDHPHRYQPVWQLYELWNDDHQFQVCLHLSLCDGLKHYKRIYVMACAMH